MRKNMEEEKKEKIYRNPGPQEIEEKISKGTIKAESANVVEDNEEEENKNPIEETVEPDGKLKKDESIFSPKKVKHKLVAGNKYHQKNIEDGYVFIRRMTAVEEGMFYDILEDITLNTFFVTITQVLDNCIRSNIEISKLCMLEKLPLFIHVLALTYGNTHTFKIECPECKVIQDQTVDILKDLKIKYFTKNMKFPVSIDLKTYNTKMTLYLMYPTIGDEIMYLDLEEKTDWIVKIRQLVNKIEGKLSDGNAVEKEHYDSIMNNLNPKKDTKRIKNELTKMSKYGIDLRNISFTCNNKKCKMWEKKQTVAIPIDQIFMNIFNAQ